MNDNGDRRQRDHIILLATDGSMPSLAATKKAVQMASESGSRLIAVTVNEATIMTPLEQKGELVAESRLKGPMSIGTEVAQRYGESQGVMVETTMLPAGPLVASILRFSEEVHPDLIILGNSGRSGWERVQLGSVAEGVMRHSRYPVLITKGFHLEDIKDIVTMAKAVARPEEPAVPMRPQVSLESLRLGRRLTVAAAAMLAFLIPYFGLGLTSAFSPGSVVGEVLGSLPLNVIWILLIFPLGWLTAIGFNRIAESYD